jgi:hypothetical protein
MAHSLCDIKAESKMRNREDRKYKFLKNLKKIQFENQKLQKNLIGLLKYIQENKNLKIIRGSPVRLSLFLFNT